MLSGGSEGQVEKGAVALFAPQSSRRVPDISSAILETLLKKCSILPISQMPKLGAQRRRDCPEQRGQVGCGNTGVCGSWGPCPGTLLALTGDQLVQGLGSGTCSHPCGFYQLSALWRQQGPRMMRVKIPPTEHLLGAGPCSHHFARLNSTFTTFFGGQVTLVTILTPKKQAWRKRTAEFKPSLWLQSLFSTKAPAADGKLSPREALAQAPVLTLARSAGRLPSEAPQPSESREEAPPCRVQGNACLCSAWLESRPRWGR